jgi:endonuclease YncB( thermonuclease family)
MYKYESKLIKVIDADTIDAMIDLGFNIWVKKRIRLSGIDAYEIRTKDKVKKKKGLAAKIRLQEILFEYNNKFKLWSHGVGKYGRCLGDIIVGSTTAYAGKSVNQMLVSEGHAKKYK